MMPVLQELEKSRGQRGICGEKILLFRECKVHVELSLHPWWLIVLNRMTIMNFFDPWSEERLNGIVPTHKEDRSVVIDPFIQNWVRNE